MKKKIQIELTPEQVKKLQPLFDAVKEHPNTGALFGQLWEPEFCEIFGHDGAVAVFQFCTPDETRAIVDKAEAEMIRRTVLPGMQS